MYKGSVYSFSYSYCTVYEYKLRTFESNQRSSARMPVRCRNAPHICPQKVLCSSPSASGLSSASSTPHTTSKRSDSSPGAAATASRSPLIRCCFLGVETPSTSGARRTQKPCSTMFTGITIAPLEPSVVDIVVVVVVGCMSSKS